MKKIVLAAALAAVFASSADAATYLFSFTTSANAVLATGSLTTADTLNSLGGYNVLSISGTANGEAITGLISDPYSPNTGYYLANGTISSNSSSNWLWSYDNTLFLTGANRVDQQGLLFKTADDVFNIFNDTRTAGQDVFGYSAIGSSTATEPTGTFAVTAAAVPEPASWVMMVGGFGLLGGALRRKKAAVSFA